MGVQILYGDFYCKYYLVDTENVIVSKSKIELIVFELFTLHNLGCRDDFLII